MFPSAVRRAPTRCCLFWKTSFSCYSGCRQYRENIQGARELVGPRAPEVDKLRVFYNHPGFIDPSVERVQAALARIPAERRAAATLVFTAHSIPIAMSESCQYLTQLEEACRLVSQRVGSNPWKLVYQSRSGPPTQPWPEPDVCDYLRELHEQGVSEVVVVPIGFISDHMEVPFDLDTEAEQVCGELGVQMVRAATVGVHPRFVTMIRELIAERMVESPVRLALGTLGASHDVCPQDCCPSGRPAMSK